MDELLQSFRVTSARLIAAMRDAARADDPTALYESAHTLAGSAGTLGFTVLQNACRSVCVALNEGRTERLMPLCGGAITALEITRTQIDTLMQTRRDAA